MTQHLATLMLFALCLASCGIQTNVMHSGQYNALPESEVADTGLYPMKHFVLVEEDGLSGKTFVYLFSGDLAEAGIGIEDLDRIALRYGKYNIAFRYPRSFFLEQTIESSGPSIPLLSGELAVGQLKPLEEDDDFYLSGAYTVLTTTSMDVLGWFGTYVNNEVDGPLTLQIGEDTLTINSPLELPIFTITTEEDRINMATGELTGLDYRIMDIFQSGTSIEDGSPREFTVATSLSPEADYFASHLLLEDAFGKSCWSMEKSLKLRITQVARRYHDNAGNPWGIIYRKINSRNLAPNDWQPNLNLDNVETEEYCATYE
jgi:hypothetical protein